MERLRRTGIWSFMNRNRKEKQTMRYLKLLLMVSIVLAFTVPASALTWLTPFSGTTPVRLNIIDWSMGKSYLDSPPLTEGVVPVNNLPQWPVPVPGAQVIPVGQVGLGGIGNVLVGETEDGWGAVKVQDIIADPGSTVYWSGAADPNFELVGLMYGTVDTYVKTDVPTGQQQVSSAGIFLDLYEQPKGTFDENVGSIGRQTFDKYTGIGFDAAGNAILNSRLLMHLESTDDKAWADATAASDIDGDGDPDGDFTASFIPNPPPPGAGTGESSLFWDLISGDWAQLPPDSVTMEADPFYFGAVDAR